MTFVSTSRFTSNSAALPYSVSVGAGDVLVGVLSAGRLSVSSGSFGLNAGSIMFRLRWLSVIMNAWGGLSLMA